MFGGAALPVRPPRRVLFEGATVPVKNKFFVCVENAGPFVVVSYPVHLPKLTCVFKRLLMLLAVSGVPLSKARFCV